MAHHNLIVNYIYFVQLFRKDSQLYINPEEMFSLYYMQYRTGPPKDYCYICSTVSPAAKGLKYFALQ